ncbi:MAG: hypothetical protein NZ959_02005 [Armatimonadetes bacterium]|nr:hypothetical protein [Armatimonadota bacterium]MDW8120834.1 hypothetical protein [Armatimonadota bacterium]
MNRTVVAIVLVIVAVLALFWAFLGRPNYPKRYEGEMPSGPGAPAVMDRPMGVGGGGGGQPVAPQQPQAGTQPF